jgi:NAD(P)-dependent dehydrogenase (short-subunit alcohol dehydrogenase family)
MPRVFFITGTSTGFGYHLVEEVLAKGDIAVATARKPESLSFKNTTDKVCDYPASLPNSC